MEINDFIFKKQKNEYLFDFLSNKNSVSSSILVSSILKSSDVLNDCKLVLTDLIQNKLHRTIIYNFFEAEKAHNTLKNDESINQFLDSIKYYMNSYNDFIEYKHLMKNENITLESYVKPNDFNPDENYFLKINQNIKKFENFNDDIQKSIIKNKANKLKKRIISKKNEHLCDDETEQLFMEMSQLDFSKEELQNNIGKKINAFSHPIELNGALMNLIDIKKGWSMDLYIEKIKNANLIENEDFVIHSNKNNKLLIEIKSFNASSVLGSKMWCITREDRMFNSYKEKEYNDYLFIYDFNKNPSDDFALVAALTNVSGNINEIYSKSDIEFSKLQDHKEQYEDYNKDIKEHYSFDLTDIDILRKLNNHKLKYSNSYTFDSDYYSSSKTTLFDFENDDDLEFLYYNLPDLSITFSFEDLKNADFVKQTETTNSDINLLNNESMLDLIDNKIYDDGSVVVQVLNENSFNRILDSDLLIETIIVNYAGSFLLELSKQNNFQAIEKIITNDLFLSKTKGNHNSFNYYSSLDPVILLLTDPKLSSYFKENDKMDLLKKIVDNSTDKPEIIADLCFFSNDVFNNLKELYPHVSDYKIDFSNFNYSKQSYIDKIFTLDKNIIDRVDFSSISKNLEQSVLTFLNYNSESSHLEQTINLNIDQGLYNLQVVIDKILENDPTYTINSHYFESNLASIPFQRLNHIKSNIDKIMESCELNEKSILSSSLTIRDVNDYNRFKATEYLIDRSDSQIDLTKIVSDKLTTYIDNYRTFSNKKIENNGIEELIELLNKKNYTLDLNFFNEIISSNSTKEYHHFQFNGESRELKNLSDLSPSVVYVDKLLDVIEKKKDYFSLSAHKKNKLFKNKF